MNQPKEFKSSYDKEGVGYERAHNLKTAIKVIPSLYDSQYMRYGVTQNFIRVSDEEKDIEEFKRSRSNKMQLSFDYTKLNDSYDTRKLNFHLIIFQVIHKRNLIRLQQMC